MVTSKSIFSAPDFDGLSPKINIKLVFGLYELREEAFLTKGIISDFMFWLPAILINLQVKKQINDSDILHCHSFYIMEMLRRKNVKNKVILSIYNPIPPRNIPDLYFADKIIFQSKSLLNQTAINQKEISHKFEYIPPGMSLSNFYNNRTYREVHKPIKILFVGRTRKFKNIEGLINAMYFLKNADPNGYLLNIVTSGPLVEKYKAHAKKLGVEKMINFHCTMNSEQMIDFYLTNDIVIVPSWYESFSLVSLEALALKRNLIVSKNMTEFLSYFPNVEKCNPSSAVDIANKIILTCNKNPIYGEIEYFKRFDWKNVFPQYLRVYEEVCARNVSERATFSINKCQHKGQNNPDLTQYYQRKKVTPDYKDNIDETF